MPFASVAKDLGSPLVKNVVALGALQGATKVFPKRRSSPPSAAR